MGFSARTLPFPVFEVLSLSHGTSWSSLGQFEAFLEAAAKNGLRNQSDPKKSHFFGRPK